MSNKEESYRRCTEKMIKNREKLMVKYGEVKHYRKSGLTLRAIGELMGKSVSTIRFWLVKHDKIVEAGGPREFVEKLREVSHG